MNTKQLILRIVNILLLIFFVWLIINSFVIQFHLVQPLSGVKGRHTIIGWIFIGLMLIHVFLHWRYYKCILTQRWK